MLLENRPKRHLLNMMFNLKTNKPELLTVPRRSMVLRSNHCILFNEERMNSKIYRKSPYVRGNKLWKQLSCDIQHATTKIEFTRMLTDNIILRLVN